MVETDYNAPEIEKKWQQRWETDKLYKVTEDPSRPKWYALTMFPYTSGALHIGHWYAIAPADVAARYKMMQGYNVLHPMGFDSFGLPAENAAIKHGIHPRTWTLQNVENMRRQLKSIGAIYDWDKEVITCLPEYYRWTQWMFLKMYDAGLAYRAKAPVNWCPKCQTVLANEQVVDGHCERCETLVEHTAREQWFFRITNYAEELLEFKDVEWPERIKIMQRNWIGKSVGTEITFDLPENNEEIKVFTTRPDTIFGVTFVVLAPEHSLVEKLTTPDKKKEVDEYVQAARHRTDIERLSTSKEKDGVFIGAYAVNKLTDEKIPIFIADYVLSSYGTGAVMAVPAHDERDFAFAKKYRLPIKTVVTPPDMPSGGLTEAYVGPGIMVNSVQFNGMPNDKAAEAINDYIESKNFGGRKTSYRLRDWLISRQRYWGTPIPMIYCSRCGIVPVPEKDLPVALPDDAEFKPTGESPLKYVESFFNTICPKCGGPATRETDTLDTFMCSNWYFLRYTSPKYDKGPFDPEKIKYWMPVDQYTGGAEHAVMHLFYARFFTKVLRDLGLINFSEPFTRLFNQGTIIYQKQKMSKSRGNVVTPEDYVNKVGADTVRAYLMFVGPWSQGGEWNDNGINGISRWLNRFWSIAQTDTTIFPANPPDDAAELALRRILHKTIKKASEDLDQFRFNTMIAALMELTNYLDDVRIAKSVCCSVWREAITSLLLISAPAVPHITEELWEQTAHPYSIHQQRFPIWDAQLIIDEQITLVIQVNGKLRDKITVDAAISEDDARKTALGLEKIQSFTNGKEIIKAIYVPGRLVNIVVR